VSGQSSEILDLKEKYDEGMYLWSELGKDVLFTGGNRLCPCGTSM